jgi:hypothetical protein
MPTLAAGATGIPNAFGIAAGAINRAYVGFDADCARDSNTAEAFWGQMASGETVQTARDRAQIEYNRIAGALPCAPCDRRRSSGHTAQPLPDEGPDTVVETPLGEER